MYLCGGDLNQHPPKHNTTRLVELHNVTRPCVRIREWTVALWPKITINVFMKWNKSSLFRVKMSVWVRVNIEVTIILMEF